MNTSSDFPASPPPDGPPPSPLPRARWWWTLLPALLFVALLWPKIDAGTLWHHDELLTANRAREMLVRGDPATLTLNFKPDFRKPPLQYWLCAASLRALPGRPELALRLPSLLGGAACLLALAWLARTAYPNDGPGLALCAVLTLAGCGYFILMSRLALLDTGAALWLTLAIGGSLHARTNPRWWWFTGAMCLLGAWQKAPYAFGAWIIMLVVRWKSEVGSRESEPADKADGADRGRLPWLHLAGALAVSAGVTASWWVLQSVLHGHDAVSAGSFRQARALTFAHDPRDAGFRPYIYWLWLARDWALPGLCAPLAVLAALWRRPRPDASPATTSRDPGPELGWVCAVFLLALAFVPFRAARYLVVITPLLALLSVRGLDAFVHWLPLPRMWSGAAVRRGLFIAALATTLPSAAFHFFSRTPAAPPGLLAAARALGHDAPPGEAIVFAAKADRNFLVTAFAAFYGDLRSAWRELPSSATGTIPPPTRGLCHRRQWPELALACPTARQVAAEGDWVVWARSD